MEVFEIKKNSLHRQSSSSPSVRGGRIPYLLSIVGIILVTSATILVLHFLLGYRNLDETLVIHRSLPKNFHSPLCEKPFCNTKGCVIIASRLLEIMNPEADPCFDFYEFSCGGYSKSTGFKSTKQSYTPADEAVKNVLIDIRKVMERPSEINESRTLGKLKQFYNSCLNTSKRERYQKQSLLDWFQEINLDLDESHGSTWRSHAATLEEYGFHTILKPSFKGSKSIPIEQIMVDCNVPQLPTNVYLDPADEENANILSVYRESIYEATKLFLGMDEDKMKEFANNVLAVETDIARAMQQSVSMNNFVLADEYILLVKELWRSMIGDSIQEVEVVSTCNHNLQGILSVLNNAHTKMSKTYIVWRMFLNLVPDIDDIQTSGSSLFFWNRDYASPWQQCSDQLRTEMGLPMFKVLMDAGYIKNERIQEVKDSFREVKRNFLLTFKSIDWAGALIKKLFLSKVNNMKLNLGYPESINQPGVMDNIFNDLEIGDNYLQNVLSLKKFKTRHYFNRLWYGHIDNSISGVSLESNPLGNKAGYDYTKNTLHVDFGLIRYPMSLHTEDIPKYLQFGEMALLARYMSHAFDSTGTFYDGRGKLWDRIYWPETLTQKYDYHTNCLYTQLYNKTFISEHSNDTLNTIIADIGSFLVPYDGLTSHLNNFQNEKPLPGLNLTKKQTYYVRIAQSYCESGGSSKQEHFMYSHRFRVNTAVSNLKDFAEVFSCPPKSKLNPDLKCSLL